MDFRVQGYKSGSSRDVYQPPNRCVCQAAYHPHQARPPYWHPVSRLSTHLPLRTPALVSNHHGSSTPSDCPLTRAKCSHSQNQPDPSPRVFPSSSYQKRARAIGAHGDRNGRPVCPQIDRSKVVPHLCDMAPRSAIRPIPPLYRYNRSGCGIKGVGFRVEDVGFRIEGFGFRV